MFIKSPKYIYLKLKPNNSILNKQTHLIGKTIASMYRPMSQQIKKEYKKLGRFNIPYFYVNSIGKIGFYIYMEKEVANFYFVVPKHFVDILKERMSEVWKNITVEEVSEIPKVVGTNYSLEYEKEDGLSLATNRANNTLLNSTINIIDVLEQGDKVGIFYNFIPTSQQAFTHTYKTTIEKVKKGIPVERNNFSFKYLFKSTVLIIDSMVRDITEAFIGEPKKHSTVETVLTRLNKQTEFSSSTESKKTSQVINTQILLSTESEERTKELTNMHSLIHSFDSIEGDNRLVGKRINVKINLCAKYLPMSANNIMSEKELQNFISLPARELLEQYPFIDKIETQELNIPKDLAKGVMCIGETTFRGDTQQAFLSNDEHYRNLALLLVGATRAGKSTLIANISKDAINAGECVIIFDFIENCELSNEVKAVIGEDKTLEIVLDDFNNLQGMGFNEVGFSEDIFKQYENAKRQTANLLALVNAINVDDSRLSPKMERYLESASLVVFINNGSIKDVFSVLLNHKERQKFVTKVPSSQHDNLSEYIDSLSELDETDKEGNVTGTKTQAGIIDRLNTLKRNTYIELMLKRSCDNNINLVEEIQKNQLITIKMPQSIFTTDGEKDVMTTYWISKIWLALQVRADVIRNKRERTKVNLVIDELYQVNYTEKFLTSKLSQIAKFICKPIISCHYINQLRYMRDELRSANASYMLLAGCDKKNFRELQEELQPFTLEDLMKLPRYHSLNIVKCKDGYARFITRLPKPVSITNAKTKKDME